MTFSRGPNFFLFGEHQVHVVRKSYQRHLRMSVKSSGQIRVICSRGALNFQIIEFINTNAKWLQKCLQKFAELREKNPPKRFVAGEKFPFLGRELELKFENQLKTNLEIRNPYILAREDDSLAKRIRNLYQEKAEFYLPSRVQYWSVEMNLRYKNLKIRYVKSTWGSCSRDGKISLNTKLICYSRDIIDYVIIHELAHLVHPNHSAYFWNLVSQYCPEYKMRRRELRRNQFICEF